MAKKETRVALLRGINVTGQKKMAMATLREVAEKLGYETPETYIQSGNLVFGSLAAPAALEVELEAAIEKRFGFHVAVMVRNSRDWERYAKGSPFPEAETERPNKLYLGVTKAPPPKSAAAELVERGQAGERVAIDKGVLWIDFLEGAGRSKLTPSVLDRVVGSSVTLRNFRTVQEIAKILRSRAT